MGAAPVASSTRTPRTEAQGSPDREESRRRRLHARLARYPQLYSRVGFVHHYKPLSADEQGLRPARHWPPLRLGNTDDYTATEAVAAITRITNGNFRLTTRLVDQIERVFEINQITTVTKVVVAARENLVIGIM